MLLSFIKEASAGDSDEVVFVALDKERRTETKSTTYHVDPAGTEIGALKTVGGPCRELMSFVYCAATALKYRFRTPING